MRKIKTLIEELKSLIKIMEHIKLKYKTFIIFIIFNLSAFSQLKYNFFNENDFFLDLNQLDSINVLELCERSKEGSLFNLSYSIKTDYYKYLPNNNLKFVGIDTIFEIISEKKELLSIEQKFKDSIPVGQWLLFDDKNTIRCSYTFSEGIISSISYFSESGNVIREILFDKSEDLIFDKYYFNNKVLRITHKTTNGYQLVVYDNKGLELINYSYGTDFIFIGLPI